VLYTLTLTPEIASYEESVLWDLNEVTNIEIKQAHFEIF
jgi:hypothetical protein